MTLTIELDREEDGRYLAEIIELPGVMAYGETEEAVLISVKALAFRVLAEKVEHGELEAGATSVTFGRAA